MDMPYIRKNILIIVVVAVLIALAVVYFVLRSQKKSTLPTGLQVPQVEIQNNPIENKVPEINPVEKANPFKYKNPLLK